MGENYTNYLGGVYGISAFEDPGNLTTLAALGETGFYTQETGVYEAIAAGDWSEIAAGMASLGAYGAAEINLQYASAIDEWLQNVYQVDWIDEGLKPSIWNSIINFWGDPTWYTDFVATVTAAKAYGVEAVAPIWSPNGDFPMDNWFTTTYQPYEEIKQACLLGGGISLDTPPGYFVAQSAAYQEFCYQEIQWANVNNLVSSVILSPVGGDGWFAINVKIVVEDYERAGAIPTAWIVENYASDASDGIWGVGSETDPNTMAGEALWVSENAETTTFTPTPVIGTSTGTNTIASDVLKGSQISGTTVPYAKITLYEVVNGKPVIALGTTTADDDGNWTVTLQKVGSGNYDIEAVAIGLNNVTSAASAAVSVTSPGPTAIIVDPSSATTTVETTVAQSTTLTFGLDIDGRSASTDLVLQNASSTTGTAVAIISNEAAHGTQEIIDNSVADANLTVYGNVGDTEIITGDATTTIINNARSNSGTLTVVSSTGANNTIGAGASTVLQTGGTNVVTMGKQIDSSVNTLTIEAAIDPDIVEGTSLLGVGLTETVISLVGGSSVTNIIHDEDTQAVTVTAYSAATTEFTGSNATIYINSTGRAQIVSEGEDTIYAGSGTLSFVAGAESGDVVYAGTGVMDIDFSQSSDNGVETYIGRKASEGNGSLTLIGGSSSVAVTLISEKFANLTAGSGAFSLTAGNAGGFTADLTASEDAELFLNGGLGNSVISGFDGEKDTATVNNVSGYTIVDGNLVLSLTDGNTVTFDDVTSFKGMTISEAFVTVVADIGHESDVTFGVDSNGESQSQYLNLINYGVRAGTEYSVVSNHAVQGIKEILDNRHALANLTFYGNSGDTDIYTGKSVTTLINDEEGNDGTLTVYSAAGAQNTIYAGSHTVVQTAGTTTVTMGDEPGSDRNELTLQNGSSSDTTRTDILSVGEASTTNVIIDNDTATVNLTATGAAALEFTGINDTVSLNDSSGAAILTSFGNSTVSGGSGTLSFIADNGSGDAISAGSGAMNINFSASAYSGTETYTGRSTGTGSLTLIGGNSTDNVTLVAESAATLTAGSGAFNLTASDAGGFTADLTASIRADLLLKAGLGNSVISGFDGTKDTAQIDDVSNFTISGNTLTVNLNDGSSVIFSNTDSTQGLVLSS